MSYLHMHNFRLLFIHGYVTVNMYVNECNPLKFLPFNIPRSRLIYQILTLYSTSLSRSFFLQIPKQLSKILTMEMNILKVTYTKKIT